MKGSMVKEQRKWQAQQDLQTLTTAAEIRQDPKRVKAAKKQLEQQAKAIEKASKIFPGRK